MTPADGDQYFATMQITLTPALDRLVEERVASGLCESPSEVVREAWRLLFEREPALDGLRREAARGECLSQMRGRGWDGNQ